MQLRNVNRVLDVAYSLNAPTKAVLALVEACIVENRFINSKTGDASGGSMSRGILQVTDATARGLHISNLDIEQCANKFLTRGFYTNELGGGGAIAIVARHPAVSAGAVAQGCQGSKFPTRYDERKGEALALMHTYDPGLLDVNWNPSSGTSSKKKKRQVAAPYQFRRGGTDGTIEDSWECLKRLGPEEVGWRCFCDRNVVYFVSDDTLMNAQPVLVVRESEATVFELDFDVDRGKSNLQATLVIHGTRWVAGPGMVVELRDCGPANGRWLVQGVRRPLADPRVEVTLTAPGEATPEPAPDMNSVDVNAPDELTPKDTGAGSGAPPKTAHHERYVFPKQIIDENVLPIARKWGMTQGIWPKEVQAMNARHGPTNTGNRSDHQGPPRIAWAVDMSNGYAPTLQMDTLASALAKKFGIPWTGSGLVSHERGGFRYQLIYRTYEGGNHFNHVHFGCRRIGPPPPAGALGPAG